MGRAGPDLGRDTAGDSIWLHGRRKSSDAAVEAEKTKSLPRPAGGRKEYKDDGNITGARRFAAQVDAVMVVHAGPALLLAATERRDGTLGETRLGAIQRSPQDPAAV